MAYPFDSIIIIYNPNSTGDSKENAVQLKRQLASKLPKSTKISLRPTKHAGHAVDIAKRYAKRDEKMLLISSSGDGGYNEVINGMLSCDTSRLAVAVIPSGNANDHYHATVQDSLIERIVAGKVSRIDIIEARGVRDGQSWQRFAHSYVGVGMTAYIGAKLTEADLNPINEKWLVLKYMIKFAHVTLKFSDQVTWQRYSSVIVANISRISKYIQLSDNTKLDDGKFELYVTPRYTFSQIIRLIAKGMVSGLKPTRRTDKVTFETLRPINLQCDGEVFALDGESEITIRSHRQRLRTLA